MNRTKLIMGLALLAAGLMGLEGSHGQEPNSINGWVNGYGATEEEALDAAMGIVDEHLSEQWGPGERYYLELMESELVTWIETGAESGAGAQPDPGTGTDPGVGMDPFDMDLFIEMWQYDRDIAAEYWYSYFRTIPPGYTLPPEFAEPWQEEELQEEEPQGNPGEQQQNVEDEPSMENDEPDPMPEPMSEGFDWDLFYDLWYYDQEAAEDYFDDFHGTHPPEDYLLG